MGTAGIDLVVAHPGSPEVEVLAAIVEEDHRLRTKDKEAVADILEEGQNKGHSRAGGYAGVGHFDRLLDQE